MTWKQPVPVSIFNAFGNDNLARDLFIHLLIRARVEDMIEPEFYEGKPYRLKRGQTIFGKTSYAEKLRSSPTAVYNACVRLTKRQDEHQIIRQANHNFTIITLKFFDKLISMSEPLVNTTTNTKKPSTNQAKDANKNKLFKISSDEIAIKELIRIKGEKTKVIDNQLYINNKKIEKPIEYLAAIEKEESQPIKVSQLPPGEYENNDGTWTIVRVEGTSRTEERISFKEYSERQQIKP